MAVAAARAAVVEHSEVWRAVRSVVVVMTAKELSVVEEVVVVIRAGGRMECVLMTRAVTGKASAEFTA